MFGERDSPVPLRGRWFARFLGHLSLVGDPDVEDVHEHAVGQTQSVDAIAQISILTADLEWSRAWYEDVAGMLHSRTTGWAPHPNKEGWQIRCCYMSAARQPECLVLVEEYDPEGGVTVPTGGCVFHIAIEVERPAEAGSSAAARLDRDLLDPDWNSIELVRPSRAGAASAPDSPRVIRGP